ncbi:MAG: hypothetical protein IJQ58_02375, partial [Synergistaceae bacterium]|nr:hypothetical protein [Synergistaceae bacterium]
LCLKDIRVTAESILSDLRKKLNDLTEEHLRRIRSAEIEAEANNLKFQNAAIKVQNFAEAQIAYRRDLLNAKIREMFNPSSFREPARAEINRVMFALIDDVNKYACGENIYGLGAELSKLYPSYTFYVPAPVLRRKKSRGFIGRTLSTVMDIIDNVLEGTPELIDVDDGYDYSYNDFHGATLKAFDDGPARWLYVRIRIFITHLAPVTKTTGFLSGYEGKIVALNDEIAQWQKLL